MWRVFLLPCLILGLLVCPLRCTVGAACGGATTAAVPNAAAASLAATSAGCSCCASQAGPTTAGLATAGLAESVETARGPAKSAPQDCGCSSCICEGAILQSDADLLPTALEAGFAAELSYGVSGASGSLAAEPRDFAAAHSLSPPGQLLNGRAARIAHQSLLI
ncbi:hypothetical protein [Candidatus Laterigemmans baculatus]|uniref:hypothetical protein n=1 Tax=Candidatus Laterigemmans baculatus TaxID=2770505 RepID=UPI0013DAFC0C|nr:hypothetical protein [Candidatus Laterigemmans baculatus]